MARERVRLAGRRTAFWGAVVGTAILGNFLLELGARYIKNPGYQAFVNFTHAGPSGKDY